MRSFKEDCYWYDEWADMNASIPYCKAGKNMDKCGLALETCAGCTEYHSQQIRTNGDRIRSMTDRDLSILFTPHDTFFCPVAQSEEGLQACRRDNWSCFECFFLWLKEEAE